MNNRYEVLVLTVPEITQDESQKLEADLDRLISKVKGSLIAFERWGKFKLSYRIRGNEYGVYFLVRLQADHAILKEIQDLLSIKYHTIVMRHLISRLEGDSLEYQRPKSLEESPTSRDMDAFLKENKMEGLLSSVDEKERSAMKPKARTASSIQSESEAMPSHTEN